MREDIDKDRVRIMYNKLEMSGSDILLDEKKKTNMPLYVVYHYICNLKKLCQPAFILTDKNGSELSKLKTNYKRLADYADVALACEICDDEKFDLIIGSEQELASLCMNNLGAVYICKNIDNIGSVVNIINSLLYGDTSYKKKRIIVDLTLTFNKTLTDLSVKYQEYDIESRILRKEDVEKMFSAYVRKCCSYFYVYDLKDWNLKAKDDEKRNYIKDFKSVIRYLDILYPDNEIIEKSKKSLVALAEVYNTVEENGKVGDVFERYILNVESNRKNGFYNLLINNGISIKDVSLHDRNNDEELQKKKKKARGDTDIFSFYDDIMTLGDKCAKEDWKRTVLNRQKTKADVAEIAKQYGIKDGKVINQLYDYMISYF